MLFRSISIVLSQTTDTILNQKGQNVICIYVAIGQKVSYVAQVVTTFQDTKAMKYTIVGIVTRFVYYI